jgi:D-alanyl-D-alanine dipeptidase
MRRFIWFLFVACSAIAQNSPIPNDCGQLVVVVTQGWTNVDGELHCYERSNSKWRRVLWKTGRKIPVVVGRSGLGYAADFQPPFDIEGKVLRKHEGDGRSPAGILGLPTAFGYAPPDQAHWIKLPYIQCTDAIECVDDGKSTHYNLVLDANKVEKPDWNSSEQMHRKDVLYRWGVIVDHNSERTTKNGSCIFLHIWEGPHKGTTGCTAMDEANLKHVMGWLDPKAKPLLVQFPITEYQQLQKSWQLPMISR